MKINLLETSGNWVTFKNITFCSILFKSIPIPRHFKISSKHQFAVTLQSITNQTKTLPLLRHRPASKAPRNKLDDIPSTFLHMVCHTHIPPTFIWCLSEDIVTQPEIKIKSDKICPTSTFIALGARAMKTKRLHLLRQVGCLLLLAGGKSKVKYVLQGIQFALYFHQDAGWSRATPGCRSLVGVDRKPCRWGTRLWNREKDECF